MSCACVLSLSLSLNSRRHVVAILSARGEKARDVPHSFPYSKLPVFFCCELPFYGKAFSTIINWLSFYCKIKWEVYSISVRKIKNKWRIGKDWLNIVSTYQLQIIVHSFWRRFNTIAQSFRKGSEKLLKNYWKFTWMALTSSVKFCENPKSSDVVLSFLLFILFPGGKHNCLHAKSKYN